MLRYHTITVIIYYIPGHGIYWEGGGVERDGFQTKPKIADCKTMARRGTCTPAAMSGGAWSRARVKLEHVRCRDQTIISTALAPRRIVTSECLPYTHDHDIVVLMFMQHALTQTQPQHRGSLAPLDEVCM